MTGPKFSLVSSVFTRTGAVTALTGDYSASQVTGAADKSSVATQQFSGGVESVIVVADGLAGATTVNPPRWVGSSASGAPTTGTWQVGDWIVDKTGKIWICTVAGTPGTWVNAGSSGNAVTSVFTRTGAVVATSGDYTAAQVTNAFDVTNNNTITDAKNIALGTGTGTQIGTATGQKVGFLGAAPAAQQANSVDLAVLLATFGFRASGGNPPLNLGSGALTAGVSVLSSVRGDGGVSVGRAPTNGILTVYGSMNAGSVWLELIDSDAGGGSWRVYEPNVAGLLQFREINQGTFPLSLSKTGSVQLGVSNIATNSTDGFPYMPAAAGAPTGTPTARSGYVPHYYDTTNHKMWVYDGGWKGIVVA